MHKEHGKFVVRGDKSVRFRREPKNFRSGGHALIGGVPFDGYGPQIHTPQPPDIGQPWSNSLLDSRSFGKVGGGHRSFRQCPVVQFSQLPPINGEGGRGGHNWKILLFTFYMFLNI